MSKENRNSETDTGGAAGGLLLRMAAISLAAAGVGAVCAYFSIRLWNNAKMLQANLSSGQSVDAVGGESAFLANALSEDVVYLAASALGGIFVMLMISVFVFSRNHVLAVSAKASGVALRAAGNSLRRAENVLISRADKENMIAGGLGAISTSVLEARRSAGMCSAVFLGDGDGSGTIESRTIESRMYAISLEAAIEAGRAGVAGRAFIDVAENLRVLAVDAEARRKKLGDSLAETVLALDESITGCAALLSGLNAGGSGSNGKGAGGSGSVGSSSGGSGANGLGAGGEGSGV